MHLQPLFVRQLGVVPYEEVWQSMQQFTDQRHLQTSDEIWLVQHPAVFTQGSAGKAEHLLKKTDIPVVQTDRGGQITYHALGQQIMYVLIDLKRLKLMGKNVGVRDLVSALERAVIHTLQDYGIESYAKPDAPGVYVAGKKISSLGLRIRKGCSFHGLAFNIQMDLTPFQWINPCGYAGLEMCQLADFISKENATCEQVAPKLVAHFLQDLGYNKVMFL